MSFYNEDPYRDKARTEERLESLRHTREHALETFNNHLDAIEEESQKAGRVARLNALILTIIISLHVSDAVDLSPYLNIYSVLGVFLIFVAFALGIVGQLSEEMPAGLSRVGLEATVEKKPDEETYLEWVIDQYIEYIETVRKKAERRGKIAKAAAASSLAGIVLAFGTGLLCSQL